MVFNDGDNRVYIVPLIELSRPDNACDDKGREEENGVLRLQHLIQATGDLTDNRLVLALNADTDAHFQQALMLIYQDVVRAGGELALQLSYPMPVGGGEEAWRAKWAARLQSGKERLEQAGIAPVASRNVDHAWPSFMPQLLEEQEIVADYSCFPRLNQPERRAVWTQGPLSADYLPSDSHAPWQNQPRSRILTVPLGSDGQGAQDENALHIEKSDLNNLARIWDALIARAEAAGEYQIVHCLFQSASVTVPALLDRWQRFLSLVHQRQGQFITSADAIALRERFNRELT